jgi:hypothetical protein
MSSEQTSTSSKGVTRHGVARWGILEETYHPNDEYSITEGMSLPQGILLRTTVGSSARPTGVSLVWMAGVTEEAIRKNLSPIGR